MVQGGKISILRRYTDFLNLRVALKSRYPVRHMPLLTLGHVYRGCPDHADLPEGVSAGYTASPRQSPRMYVIVSTRRARGPLRFTERRCL